MYVQGGLGRFFKSESEISLLHPVECPKAKQAERKKIG